MRDIRETIFVVLKIVVLVLLAGMSVLFALSVILFALIVALNQRWYIAMYLFASTTGLAFILGFILYHVQKVVKIAFADPEVKNYVRKTDKELFNFLAGACVMSFLFAIITFQIFIYVALLYWFYFIIFMLMFSRVWKFHGKKPVHLYSILTATTIVSFIVAPAVRYAFSILLNFLNVY
jgi:hypothetical protein